MKKSLTKILITIISLVSLITISQKITTQTANAATTTADPVFFVVGSYSDSTTWDKMYQRLDPTNSHPIVKLYVSENGAVTRTNVRTTNNNERPFVTVSFEDILWNDQAVYTNAACLQNAIESYRAKDSFKSADIVAHSNGGNVVTRYMETDNSVNFNNFISVGTPYNMRATNGQPATDMLLCLVAGANRLNHNMNVINVIGSAIGDSSTDTVVSRDSALAGSHIFYGNVASFSNLYLTGNDGVHPNQASSAQLAQILSSNLDL